MTKQKIKKTKNKPMKKNKSPLFLGGRIRLVMCKATEGDFKEAYLEENEGVDIGNASMRDELPSWKDILSRNDVNSIDNNQRSNTQGLSIVQDVSKKIYYADDEIIKNNIGSSIHLYTKKFTKKKRFINGIEFFKPNKVKVNFKVLRNNGAIFNKSTNYTNKFSQKETRDYYSNRNFNLKFKNSSQMFDFGTDYLVKKTSGGSDVSKVWINSEAFKLRRKFNFSGTFVSNFTPIANKIESQKFTTVLPLFMMKRLIYNNKIYEKMFNKRKFFRDLNQCSKFGSVKINYYDGQSIRGSDWYSDTRDSDGINKINIYIEDGQEKTFALILHYLLLYRLPYTVGSLNNTDCLPSYNYDFGDSIKIETINVLTKDVIKFQSLVENITLEDLVNETNLQNSLTLFKSLIPCKFSMEGCDSLLFLEYSIKKLQNFDNFKNRFTMPVTALPSDIGVLEIIEPNYSGLTTDIIPVEFLELNVQKFNNITESANTFITIVIKEKLNELKNKDRNLNYLTSEIESSVENILSGNLTSDKIYSNFLNTTRITPLFTFIPGMYKGLKKLLYPDISKLMVGDYIKIPIQSNYASLGQQKVFKEHQFPYIFSSEWSFSKIEIKSGVVNAETFDVDIIKNILYRKNVNNGGENEITGQTNSYSINTEEKDHYLDNDIMSGLDYNISEKTFRIELESVENSVLIEDSVVDETTVVSQEDQVLLVSKVVFVTKPIVFTSSLTNYDPLLKLKEVIVKIGSLPENNKKNLLTYLETIRKEFSGKQILVSKDNKNNKLTIFHYGLDTELIDKIIKKFGDEKINIDFLLSEDVDIRLTSGGDWSTDEPPENQDGSNDYETFKDAKFTKTKKIKNTMLRKNVIKFLAESVLDVSHSMNESGVDFLEKTSDGECFRQTVTKVLESKNLKISENKKLKVLEEMETLLESGHYKDAKTFFKIFRKYGIPILILIANSRDLNECDKYLTVADTLPREIVFFSTLDRHVGKISENTYVELNAMIFRNKESLYSDHYRWYRVMSTMCRSGMTFEHSVKIIEEQLGFVKNEME